MRLLDAARQATAHLPPSRRISNFDQLRVDLGQSPQAWNAWKNRGLSKDGALLAEERYGVFAVWLLQGATPKRLPTGTALGAGLRAEEPSKKYLDDAVDLPAALVEAVLNLPAMRYAAVRAVLDEVLANPEMRDDAIGELRRLLADSEKRQAIG